MWEDSKLAAVFMRSVFLGATLFVLAGCATISMVPGEATVETGIGESQSSLHAASDAYCEQIEAEGWAPASRGFAAFADILVNGRSDDGDAASDYAALIDADTASPTDLIEIISADTDAARFGLIAVTEEARAVLVDLDIETNRKDVTSFERALVRAQRASRAFANARDIVAERTTRTDAVDSAINAFEAEIDAARRVADDLADRYASIGDTSV